MKICQFILFRSLTYLYTEMLSNHFGDLHSDFRHSDADTGVVITNFLVPLYVQLHDEEDPHWIGWLEHQQRA